jgi:hypothetical protein
MCRGARLVPGFRTRRPLRTVPLQRTEARIRAEHTAAATPTKAPGILLIGNSLLLHSVDAAQLNAALPGYAVRKYAIENTYLWNWRWALRQLFDEGARPSYIAIVMSPQHMARLERERTGYTARYLVSGNDLAAFVRDAPDHTAAAGWALAHVSSFYGAREEIRNFTLNLVAPSYAAALEQLAITGSVASKAAADVEHQPVHALAGFNTLAAAHGARLLAVVPPHPPPPPSGRNIDTAFQTAAAAAGLTVFIPAPTEGLAPRYFSDGFHTNDEGARLFTQLLARQLAGYLAANAPPTPPRPAQSSKQ